MSEKKNTVTVFTETLVTSEKEVFEMEVELGKSLEFTKVDCPQEFISTFRIFKQFAYAICQLASRGISEKGSSF